MNILFFIILPLATILISIVLQKILKSPTLVAILVFAVYLILAFTAFTTEFLVNALVYTLLAFITASIVQLICCLSKKFKNSCHENNLNDNIENIQNSIDSLEDNIDNLTDILSNLINNNSCGCNNRRILR